MTSGAPASANSFPRWVREKSKSSSANLPDFKGAMYLSHSMPTVKQSPPVVRDKFLVFGSPLIGEEEIEEVVATLRSGWIGTGPRVAKFEEMMAEYTGAKF